MSSHTPGPWSATHGTKRVSGPPSKGYLTIANASVGQSRSHDRVISIGPEEAAANARLIAAAPDLLAALKQVEAEMRAGFGSSFGETREQVRRAISSAEGSRP